MPHLDTLHIGGHSAAAIMGLNPYSNAVDVWGEWVLGIRDNSSSPAKNRGHVMEPILRGMFAEDGFVASDDVPFELHYYRDDLPWAAASPDDVGVWAERRVVVDYKSVSNWNKSWGNGPPPHIVAQLQWYMEIMGMQHSVVYAGFGRDTDSGFVLNDKPTMYCLERDEKFGRRLVEAATALMENIKAKVRPPGMPIYRPRGWRKSYGYAKEET